MSWWEAALLGLIQGVTEFLPVSSSGHLVLGRHLLGVGTDPGSGILFEALVHLGTVFSIIVVYRREILALTLEFVRGVVRPSDYRSMWSENESFRLSILILVTMIPTGITYLVFKNSIEAAFANPRFTSAMLLVTGLVLLLTRLRKKPSGQVTTLKAIGIGIAQSAAMLPGISRSGATISAGIYLDVEPERATNFSFLMLLPVVLIGAVLEVSESISTGVSLVWTPMIIGLIVAFLSGILAIKLVLDVVRKGRLEYFAIYLFIIGGIGLSLL
ncbi:MAG: undecaprenyl-diphosphate phosphatase [Rhodothermia bacterium]|nr:MAG: undecaprenyl-diphosphate phosphatase [Rhodothermia bacterium]